MSFTLLDWVILKRIFSQKDFKLDVVDKEQRLQLCFNIFPACKTALHLIEKASRQKLDDGDKKTFDPIETVQSLFDTLDEGIPGKNIGPGQFEMLLI